MSGKIALNELRFPRVLGMMMCMSDEFTAEEIATLSRYVTNPTGDTFCVINIPGLAGPVYARYSRAITGLRRTLLKEFVRDGEINVTRTQELIERILNQYGDDSVGELEGAHLAVEQVSNLGTKIIEDARIGGSPIEQSTRYVFYDQKNARGEFKYYRGTEILNSRAASQYTSTLDAIFSFYESSVATLTSYFNRLKPLEDAEYDLRGDGSKQKFGDMETDALQKQFRITYNADLRTKACDVLRSLLPAATLTNVGLFGNGRFYQGLLTRLYSSELPECRDRAAQAHAELDKVIPKFVKRARIDQYARDNSRRMYAFVSDLLGSVAPAKEEACVLMALASNPSEYRDVILANALYKYSRHPFRQLLQFVGSLSGERKREILENYCGERKTRRDRPGRAFEAAYPLTFDIQADFGAYRDLQRHRILTQERQLLHPGLGYDLPSELEVTGLAEKARECFQKSAELHSLMEKELGPEIAQYAVLFGYKIRWSMGMNLREAMHMIELRTTPQGHPSYRSVCQNMMREIQKQHPDLASTFRFADFNDYYWSRAESEAKQRHKERQLDQKYGSPDAD